MRPIIQDVASGVTGAQSPICVDNYSEGSISVGVQLVSGTATFTVQYTLVPLDGTTAYGGTIFTAANAPWYDTSIAAGTASTAGLLVGPVTALRINVTASTAGVLRFIVLQQGGSR